MSAALHSLSTALRLRCPGCRRESLFQGPFRMHKICPGCGYLIEREEGYFVGAIYVNYAATVGLCLTGYLLLEWLASPPLRIQLLLWIPVCVLFPVLFFRHSRSIWLSLDHFFTGPAERAAVHFGGDAPPGEEP